MKLCIVYEDIVDGNKIYAEFNPKVFKKTLIREYKLTKSIPQAFDRTCDLLKKSILTQ